MAKNGEQWEQLRKLALALEVDLPDLPDDGNERDNPRELPEVQLVPSLNDVAERLGDIISRKKLLYVNNNRVVKIDKELAMMQDMDPDEFRTWVSQYAWTWKWNQKEERKVQTTMVKAAAQAVLNSPFFRDWLPKLDRVSLVRIPVWRAGEAGKRDEVALLPEGYDELSRTYTMPGVKIVDDLSLEDALIRLKELFQHFPWGDSEEDYERKRSVAVQMAIMVSLYGRALMPKGAMRPGFVWDGNRRRCGKTLLCKMALSAAFGKVVPTPRGREDRFEQKVNAIVYNGIEVLYIDNVKRKLDSDVLEALMTSPEWGDRILGEKGWFSCENKVWLCLTANAASVSEDLGYRCLTVKLFSTLGDPLEEEQVPKGSKILDRDLATNRWRGHVLSALWALIREWAAAPERHKGGRALPGFDEWSEIFGGVVMHAGFLDPVTPMAEGEEISSEAADFKALLKALVADLIKNESKEEVYEFADVVRIAREHALFIDRIGSDDDDQETKSAKRWRTSFGKFLSTKNGTTWVVDKRRVVFGTRGEKHRKYLVRFE